VAQPHQLKRFLCESLPALRSQLADAGLGMCAVPAGTSITEADVEPVARACDEFVAQGELLVPRGTRTGLRQTAQRAFRATLVPWASGNPILEHALGAEPPADAPAILDALYTPAPTFSGSGIGGLLDRYLRDRLAFVAQRKDRLIHHLASIFQHATGQQLRILGVGAGSCREWLELDWDLGRPTNHQRRVELIAVDPNTELLRRAALTLQRNRLISQARYLTADLRHLDCAVTDPPHSFTVVYAAGPADFLADGALADLIRTGYRHVAPGGHLLVTHVDAGRAPLAVAEWFFGVAFMRRTADEFTGIVRRVTRQLQGTPRVRVLRDPQGPTLIALVEPVACLPLNCRTPHPQLV
jgi:hypothetical protein